MLGPLTYGALRSGGAGAFAPSDIDGLALWLENCAGTLYQDTGAATPVASDSDPVGLWQDLNGNNNFIQATAGLRPLYKTGVIDTMPVVLWDGSDDYLESQSVTATWKFLHDGTDFVISFVARITSDAPDGFQYLFGTTNTSISNGLWIGYDNRVSIPAVDRLRFVVSSSGVGSHLLNLEVDNTWPSAEWVTITIRHTNGAVGDDYEIYLNGVLAASANISGTHNSGDPAQNMSIGHRGGGTGGRYRGDLASLIIYSGSNAASRLGDIWAYQDAIKEGQNSCDYAPPFDPGGGEEGRFSFDLINRSADLGTANCQGAAYDGTHYYLTASNTVYKFSRNAETNEYTLVTSSDLSADLPEDATQVNGMNIHDGYLWVGANNYGQTPRMGWVVQVDLSDLSHVANHEVDAHWCEGGAWHDVGDGNEYWAVFHDWDSVSRYKFVESVWTKVDDYVMPLIEGLTHTIGSQGLYQGAAWYGDILITQTHNNNPDTETHFHGWNGTGFDAIEAIDALGPSVGQGIHWEIEGSIMLFAERSPDENGQTIIRATFTDNET